MLVRRDAFAGIGGFDEQLAMSYNDVDLCLRLRAAGWRIVWTPNAELYHKESASFGRHNLGTTKEQWTLESEVVRRRWAAQLSADPHYNPNLSLDAVELWQPAQPPRVAYPWRAHVSVCATAGAFGVS
jgi:GT2 family glycosyltransferase